MEWHYLSVGKVCIFVWGKFDILSIFSVNIRNGRTQYVSCQDCVYEATEGRSIGNLAGDGEEIPEVP